MEPVARATTLAEWFATFFPALESDERIEIRCINKALTPGVRREFFPDAEHAAEHVQYLIDQKVQYNVFFGVNPRLGERGGERDVSSCRVLHAELDGKLFTSGKAGAWDAIQQLTLAPSVVLDSGAGYHLYWFLTQPASLEQAGVARSLKQLLLGLYQVIGHQVGGVALDRVQDLSRILRPPGVVNYKYENQPVSTVVLWEPERRYTFEQVAAHIPAPPVQPTSSLERNETPSREISAEQIREMLAAIPRQLDYLDWLRVLASVHSQFPNQTGIQLCEEWSPGYPGEVAQKFRSFKRQNGNTVSLGTLFWLARKHGWRPALVAGPRMTFLVKESQKKLERRHERGDWEERLAKVPPLELDDLPYHIQLQVKHIIPLAKAFPFDWPLHLVLTAWSSLWSNLRLPSNLGLNLWLIAIARSGAGKNVTSDEIVRLYHDAAEQRGEQWNEYTSGSPEGMIRALEGKGVQLLVYQREFASFLAGLDRDYQATAKGTFCDLYDQANVNHRLSRGNVIVQDPYPVIIATTTPAMILKHAKLEDLLSGYLSRFWWLACDHHNVDIAPTINPATRWELAKLLNQHYRRLSTVTNLTFAPPLSENETYRAWKLTLGIGDGKLKVLEDEDDHEMPAGRHVARCLKLAALLELAEAEPNLTNNDTTLIIGEENMERAIRITERSIAHQHRLVGKFAQSDDEKLMLRIEAKLAKDGPQQVRALYRFAGRPAREVRAVLNVLQEAGIITNIKVPGDWKAWYTLSSRPELLLDTQEQEGTREH